MSKILPLFVFIFVNIFGVSMTLEEVHKIENTSFCPTFPKCTCSDPLSLSCQNLSQSEVHLLFRHQHRHTSSSTEAESLPNIKNINPLNVTTISSHLQSQLPMEEGLESLTIINSDLQDLRWLPRFERLRVLNVSNNKLDRVFPFEKGELPSTRFDFFITVRVLDASNNMLKTISRDVFFLFPNLEELHLTGNHLFAIDWEAFRLVRLKRLYLNRNNLLNVPEHAFRFSPSLEVLNLAQNQLVTVQSSSFFAAQRLQRLDLSRNRIQRIDYDSFSPLFQLEHLDLSWNNISTVPADLRQFVALRSLNLSGNPLLKLSEGELAHPMLQRLHMSQCPNLRLIEARAFARLPNLQFLLLSMNPELRYISPQAFNAKAMLFKMDVSNCSLESLDPDMLIGLPTRLHLVGNPLRCACIRSGIERFSMRIVDLSKAQCTTSKGNQISMSSIGAITRIYNDDDVKGNSCSATHLPLLPMGSEVVGRVGDFFSLYCTPIGPARLEGLRWILPNGTNINVKPLSSSTQNSVTGSSTLSLRQQQYAPGSDDSVTFGSNTGEGEQLDSTDANSDDDYLRVDKHNFLLGQAFAPPPNTIGLDVVDRKVTDRSNVGTASVNIRSSWNEQQILPREKQQQDERQDHHRLTSNHPQFNGQQLRPRIVATRESLQFEVLMSADAGEYRCRSLLGVDGNSTAKSMSDEARIRLRVHTPIIDLRPVEVGSHFVSLVWNDSLTTLRALDRVQFQLRVLDTISGRTGRVIQLSPHNPWRSYNVMRLRPDTNYTFCLMYSLRQEHHFEAMRQKNIDQGDLGADDGRPFTNTMRLDPPPPEAIILQTCTSARTMEPTALWTSMSPTTMVVLATLAALMFVLVCARAIYTRFYIWHDAKLRARMNQSMSGQSFISSSRSTTNCNGVSTSASHHSKLAKHNGFLLSNGSGVSGGKICGNGKRFSSSASLLLSASMMTSMTKSESPNNNNDDDYDEVRYDNDIGRSDQKKHHNISHRPSEEEVKRIPKDIVQHSSTGVGNCAAQYSMPINQHKQNGTTQNAGGNRLKHNNHPDDTGLQVLNGGIQSISARSNIINDSKLIGSQQRIGTSATNRKSSSRLRRQSQLQDDEDHAF